MEWIIPRQEVLDKLDKCAVLQEQVRQLTEDWLTYDRMMKHLVGNLVVARNLQPVDNAIVQDIDDAIDALVSYTKVVVLLPKEKTMAMKKPRPEGTRFAKGKAKGKEKMCPKCKKLMSKCKC